MFSVQASIDWLQGIYSTPSGGEASVGEMTFREYCGLAESFQDPAALQFEIQKALASFDCDFSNADFVLDISQELYTNRVGEFQATNACNDPELGDFRAIANQENSSSTPNGAVDQPPGGTGGKADGGGSGSSSGTGSSSLF